MAVRKRVNASVADTVSLYLDEVSSHELLTAEDEVRLARVMEDGRRAEIRLAAEDDLTPMDRRRLSVLVEAGQEA
jgi:RNA polymerase primary sigma factor